MKKKIGILFHLFLLWFWMTI